MAQRRTTLFSLVLALSLALPAGCLEPAGRAETRLTPQGMVYYVAPTGDDSNPGTLDHPWQTIQKAADTLVAGNTVYIRAGTYNERVVPQNSGSAGSPITYAAYLGEAATIDGSGITLPDDLAGLFDISNKSYLQVSGLRVINAGPYNDNAGILVNASSYITLAQNSIYNTISSGIQCMYIMDAEAFQALHGRVQGIVGYGYRRQITDKARPPCPHSLPFFHVME